jgi:hypothetical protein
MSDARSEKLTGRDRATLRLLRVAPWVAFALLAVPAPLYFFLRYLAATEAPGEWLLVTFVTLFGGVLAGLLVVLLFFAYRKIWLRRLRGRLTSGGITADELQWFTPELTREERAALAEIESRSPALADAYRETLAARLTATHLLARAGGERERVERRLADAARLPAAERAALEVELRDDRERLARVEEETRRRRAQAEARLRTIEAAASRDASEQETRLALDRLELTQEQVPASLEAARLEREAREEIERELRSARQGQLGRGTTKDG